MKVREFNPARLDVAALAQAGASLSGQWPLSGLERLAACAAAGTLQPQQQVSWRIAGELRPQRAGAPEIWLHLQAATTIALECQRCLQPAVSELDVESAIRFVASEEEAAELDADSEDDVLALTRSLDAQALIEDELLLALPIVPRHEVCPAPLPGSVAPETADAVPARQNPFAALEVLKRRGSDEEKH